MVRPQKMNIVTVDGEDMVKSAVPAQRCTICQTVKPLTEYYDSKNTLNGKEGRCKKCRTAQRRKQRAEERARIEELTEFRAKEQIAKLAAENAARPGNHPQLVVTATGFTTGFVPKEEPWIVFDDNAPRNPARQHPAYQMILEFEKREAASKAVQPDPTPNLDTDGVIIDDLPNLEPSFQKWASTKLVGPPKGWTGFAFPPAQTFAEIPDGEYDLHRR